MLRHIQTLTLALLGASTLTMAADDERQPPAYEGAGLTQDCFYIDQVNNWTALDRTTLIVYAPTKSRAYLVKVSPSTSGLRFENTLAFFTPRGRTRMCGYAGERIVLSSGGRDDLFVNRVMRLDAATLEHYLALKKAWAAGEPLPVMGDGDSKESDQAS